MWRRLATFCMISVVSVGTTMGLQQNDQSKSKTSNSTTQQRDTANKQKDQKMQDMHHNQNSTGSQTSAGMLSSDDREFVMKAAHGGMMEVELGQLAVSKASNADVKQFAQRMVDDHGKANQELMQLAQNKGITLPSSNMSGTNAATTDSTTGNTTGSTNNSMMNSKEMQEHQKLMDKLNKLSGSDFDKAYMSEMVKDHQKDVAMFEKEASKGKDSDVKSWASTTLPTLRDHLQMARDTAAKVGGKGNSSSGSTSNSSNTSNTKKP